ncbi:hypothetical protein G9F32_02995 [Acinetobacter sp. 194]|uniref:hypothetical protein n=1 Tax=Acinetobacter shaoyimingii TaxID=2715164 RepID=UPI00140D2D44|nr:hypothetical protein [Acinetobacter shaoyimingii]NHB57000.1 hypothetical protein [Acinetobacter shaoyimingii]
MHNELTKEQTLLSVLRGKFASQFAKRFGDMEPHIVDMIIKGALVGISDEQFNQGMARLLAPGNKFMPDISEFQTWCVSGSWWTAQEAWQRACDYSNLTSEKLAELAAMKPVDFLKQKNKITTLTKKAWDSVNYLVTQGSMKEAFSQFKSIYETYLAKAQMQGRQQEWYVPPVMISAPKVEVKNTVLLADDQEKIKSLTAQLMSEGMKWGEAFKKAEYTVRGETRAMFGGVV